MTHEPGQTPPVTDQAAGAGPASWPALAGCGAPWLVVSAGVILTLVLVARIPEGVFYSGDGGLKALLAKQFAAGRWHCDLQLAAEPWLRDLWDKGAYPFAPPFVYHLGERDYLAFPVTFPLVTAPFYAWFGYRGLYVLPLVGLWLTWWQFHALCKRFGLSPGEATLSMAGLVLASPLTLYGAMYWEHTLAVGLAFAGIATTLRPAGGARTIPGHVLGGMLLGLSVWLRPECLCVVGAVLLAFFVYSKRGGGLGRWCVFSGATLLGVGAFALFNFLVYGDPLGAHARQVVEGFDFAEHALKAVSYCWWLNAWLLIYVPVVIFILIAVALPAIGPPLKLTPAVSYLLTVLVLASVSIPLIVPHAGGKMWGPRFLLGSVPVATLAAALLLQQLRRERGPSGRLAALGVLVVILLAGGVLNTGLGTRELSRDYATRVAPALNFLRDSDRDVVLVTHQWAAQELQALFDRKHILRLHQGTDVDELARALRRRGYDRLWLIRSRYDHRPAEQRLEIEGQRFRLAGSLVQQLGENFFAYDCAILDRE